MSFKQLLKNQDYSEILQQSDQAQTTLEKYYVLRAAFVLGDKAKARELIDQYSSVFELAPFIQAQELTYHQGKWREGFEALIKAKNFPLDPFLKAELNFLLGFFLCSQCLFNLCPPYFKKSIELYKELGLINHASHAYYNLGIAFDHLKEKHLVQKVVHQFAEMVHSDPKAKIAHLLYQKLQACLYLDAEEFEKALFIYDKLIADFAKLKRYRDLGAAMWVRAYLLHKLDREEEKNIPVGLTIPHQKAIELFQALENGECFDFISTKTILKKYLSEGVLKAAVPYWLERVCATFERNKKYTDLLNCVRYAIHFSIQSQLDPYLIDFQYYEILSRLKLGDLQQARYLLALYTQDSIENNFTSRIVKSKKLKDQNFSNQNLERQPFSMNVELDLNRHLLKLNGLEKNLKKTPVLEKAVLTLAKYKICAIDQFFIEIYGVEYLPWNHERRLSTLINRLRVLFGFKNAVIRNNKEISLDESIRKIKVHAVYGRVAKEKRKINLEEKIRKIQRPISISELENIINIPRRTLQLDLSNMVKEGFLLSSGVRKNKKYWVSSRV